MMMKVSLKTIRGGTRVTFLFTNIPPVINPEDNEASTRQTLEKLVDYVQKKKQ